MSDIISSDNTGAQDGSVILGNGLSTNGVSEKLYHDISKPNGVSGGMINPNGNASGSKTLGFVPIAICGMACRLPGNIHSPQDLWNFLLAKGDARTRVPPTRYNISGYHSSTKKPGAAVSEYGYFLDESTDLGALDTSFFPMARAEVERLDPQQRLLLEVSRECLDDAGEVGWKGKNVGVYVGSFGNDWYDVTQTESQRYGMYQVSTTHDFALSNRISYEMDLRGPSMTIRTACSSSLICINEACAAIAKGDCASAIVGGTNILMAPALTTEISEQGALSPDGSCKTFSAAANGYVRGEGVVCFYVKSLDDALRDGNPIRAVVVGSAANSDGKTPGFSVPSATAQERLIRHTYELAGISEVDMCKTGFFECHGTGTPVGDPIETEAIANVFGDSGGIHIGSVKPNLGHGEGASGLTAMLKAVLALEHRTIPPNIKSSPRNENIPFDRAKLSVPVEATAWPDGRHERVSVNSFGVGGANAHVIIESTSSFNDRGSRARSNEATTEGSQLLLYSATNAQSLKDLTSRYSEFLDKMPDNTSLADVAYTLATKREHFPIRSFAVGTRLKPGVPCAPVLPTNTPSVVMVFTGQGSQWAQMGLELYHTNSVFRLTIASLDDHLQNIGSLSPGWRIGEELLKESRTSRINDAEFSQPLCAALQVALLNCLAAVGIRPAAVVGHSSGEIAAAFAAGALTAEEAIEIAFLRGLASKQQTKAGSMAAVSLSREEAGKHLRPGVVIACDNSPGSVTLSGDVDALQEVAKDIKGSHPGVLVTNLKIAKAYHSHHMSEVGETFQRMMNDLGVSGRSPAIPFFSTLTGELLAEGVRLDSAYWQRNLVSPVLFNSAVSNILSTQLPALRHPVFLEIGPHAALAGPLRQIMKHNSSTSLHIPTIMRGKDSADGFLAAVGRLWTLHLDINLSDLIPEGRCLPDLPRYPWNHQQRHWFESRVSREWRMREHPYHDLLGVRVPESSRIEPIWRNILHLSNAPWLRDHVIRKDIVYPLACYIAMAAEAVRQISGIQESVELRKVTVNMALVLHEGAPTELVTSLRRHRLTDSQDSTWWDFTVTSYNGHTWTKHCFGQVRASTETSWGEVEIPDDYSVSHRVHVRQWYECGRRGGSGYGHHFTTLQDLKTSASGVNGLATATAQNNWHGDESNYHLHPILIDTYLQLLCSAVHHGMRHSYRQLIPANVGWLAFSRCSDDSLRFIASSKPLGNGAIGAGSCLAASRTVMKASDVTVHPLAEKLDTDTDPGVPITARIEWVPHIDFQRFDKLVKPVHDQSHYLPELTQLTQLAITHSQRLLSDDGTVIKGTQMESYKAWLDKEASIVTTHHDMTEVIHLMDQLFSSLATTPASPVTLAIANIHASIRDLASGQRGALELLDEDDTLHHVYAFMRAHDPSGFLQCLGHSKPNLRVLELGAGVGTGTTGILEGLRRPNGQSLYSKYVYSDALPGMVVAAKDRFKGIPNMHFATLDITRNPDDQGFEGEQFDLIIMSNTIQESTLRQSLVHARRLLGADGRLLLQQPRRGVLWTKYILGVMPDWWSNADNGKPADPYIPFHTWEDELTAAGFGGIEAVGLDSPETACISMVAVAETRKAMPSPKLVTLLCDPAQVGETDQLEEELQRRDFQVSRCTLLDDPPAAQDVIVILDQYRSFLDSFDSDSFAQLKKFLSGLRGASGVLWVTKSSQTHCPDPSYAPVIGFARTIRAEMAIDFSTCEVADGSSHGRVAEVFCRFHSRDRDATMGPDYEYAIDDGTVRVSRFFPFALEDEIQVSVPSDEVVLQMDRPGRLDSFHWAESPAGDLVGDEVEIAVHASGLNFRDVLVATGIIRLSSRDVTFGYEGTGIVRRIGPDAKKLRVGDRAVFMSVSTLSTVIITTEKLCEKLPEEMSFADGASMPIVFATAIYSLIDIVNLQQGQSVLIHSGCGGVGLAAIQIAKLIGAEIYTTVSNEEKASYILENFGIPRNRIFQSRNDSFYEDLMHQTDGRGADVVLNSLSGELLHKTWRCVAKWGTMVEIGKRDLLEAGKLDLDVFLSNRSYRCVAIDEMREDRPELAGRLLRTMMSYYRQGHIKPIRLAQVSSGSAPQEAFKYMQKGSHIGKVIISLRDGNGAPELGEANTVRRRQRISFDGLASYLLVGGFGGLGRSVATFLAQHGARNLTFFSPRAGCTEDQRSFVLMLENLGCTVQIVRGSITNTDDVYRAVDACPRPLRGIFQMSMTLRDQSFSRMTIDDWKAATEPKITGTWNLHLVTRERGINLEFLLLFSSLSGIMGQPGQANYAAANTFLDAFMRYRHGLGLPCTSVDIGAIEGAGYLFENEDLLKKMQGTGWRSVKEEELLNAVAVATSNAMKPHHDDSVNLPGIIAGENLLLGISPTTPLSSPNSSARLRRDIRMAVYHNVRSDNSSDTGGSDDSLRSFLTSVKANPQVLRTPETANTISLEIGRQLFSLLLKTEQTPDTKMSLSDLGLDSMVAVELRAWWKLVFGLDISVLEMLVMGTLEALGKRATEELASKYGA